MCGGASSAQKQLSQEQSQFYQQLQQNYGTEFAGQQSILNSLSSAFAPIVGAGVNQQGFSAPELAAMNTAAINNSAGNYANAARAVNEQIAGRGGGNMYLPSGTSAAIQGNIAAQAAGNLSNAENQITQANYQQGRQNFFNAAGALGGVASTYNPASFAGQATGAGNAAFGSATQIYNQGNQWMGMLGGALGGAVGTVASGLSGGLGTEVSNLGSGNWGW